jgi:hypothetical protein
MSIILVMFMLFSSVTTVLVACVYLPWLGQLMRGAVCAVRPVSTQRGELGPAVVNIPGGFEPKHNFLWKHKFSDVTVVLRYITCSLMYHPSWNCVEFEVMAPVGLKHSAPILTCPPPRSMRIAVWLTPSRTTLKVQYVNILKGEICLRNYLIRRLW